MRPEAEAQDQHGAGGTARGMLPHEGPQLRDSYVEELCVDGSKSAVVNLRRGFQVRGSWVRVWCLYNCRRMHTHTCCRFALRLPRCQERPRNTAINPCARFPGYRA